MFAKCQHVWKWYYLLFPCHLSSICSVFYKYSLVVCTAYSRQSSRSIQCISGCYCCRCLSAYCTRKLNDALDVESAIKHGKYWKHPTRQHHKLYLHQRISANTEFQATRHAISCVNNLNVSSSSLFFHRLRIYPHWIFPSCHCSLVVFAPPIFSSIALHLRGTQCTRTHTYNTPAYLCLWIVC